MNKKNIMSGVAGIIVGAGAMMGAGAISAQEVITVNDNGLPLDKVPVTISQEITETKDVVSFSGTMEELDRRIKAQDSVIRGYQGKINNANNERVRLQDLKVKIQVELNRLPERRIENQ